MNTHRTLITILLATASGCQTLSTEDACRARAATLGVQLEGPALVQEMPGTERVIYGWEAPHNGRPGFQCTTQRGHVQDVEVLTWGNSRPPTG